MHDSANVHQAATSAADHHVLDVASLVSAMSTCASSDPGPDPSDDPDDFPTQVSRA
jgi:hypothetical protein